MHSETPGLNQLIFFSAACAETAKTAALVTTHANADLMNLHLIEISKAISRNAHGVLVLDGAGWHQTAALKVPQNITLLHLPPYSPELNPIENVWAYLRANKLAMSIFDSMDDIFDKCCEAWNFFANDKKVISSIVEREYAKINQN